MNHSRPSRIVSRLVLHSADGDVHVLSSFCCPRATVHSRAVVMITAGRSNHSEYYGHINLPPGYLVDGNGTCTIHGDGFMSVCPAN